MNTFDNMLKSNNPWAGLISYEDPIRAERQLLFCGRDDESYDVGKLIKTNVVVTLYGKSGIGKTSLLNAGVFPELRQTDYLPIRLRLGLRDENDTHLYQDVIIKAIEKASNHTEEIDIIPPQKNRLADDFLWNYFARHRFYNHDGESVKIVVVFDQFEELFRQNRLWVGTLLRQLHYFTDKDHMLDSCVVNGYNYRYQNNYRFVISIREDDIYHLEDSIDKCFLHSLKHSRYRLCGLSEQNAISVIRIPGYGLFHENEFYEISNRIIDISRNKEDGTINTNILSLVCNRIFVDWQQTNMSYISSTLVNSFVQDNPFERFYKEATRNLSSKSRGYLEKHLVDSTGRRNSISERDFFQQLPEGRNLLEGDNRILQRISTSSDDSSFRIELIHDSFCKPLLVLKEKRERKHRIKLYISIIMGILIVCGLAVALTMEHRERMAKDDAIKKQKKLEEQLLINAMQRDSILQLNGQYKAQRDSTQRLNEQYKAQRDSLKLALSSQGLLSYCHEATDYLVDLESRMMLLVYIERWLCAIRTHDMSYMDHFLRDDFVAVEIVGNGDTINHTGKEQFMDMVSRIYQIEANMAEENGLVQRCLFNCNIYLIYLIERYRRSAYDEWKEERVTLIMDIENPQKPQLIGEVKNVRESMFYSASVQ